MEGGHRLMGTVRIQLCDQNGIPCGEMSVETDRSAAYSQPVYTHLSSFPYSFRVQVTLTTTEERLHAIEEKLDSIENDMTPFDVTHNIQNQVGSLAARMDSLRLVEGVKPSELQDVVDSLEHQIDVVHEATEELRKEIRNYAQHATGISSFNEFKEDVNRRIRGYVIDLNANITAVGRLRKLLDMHTHTIDTKAETFTTGRAKVD